MRTRDYGPHFARVVQEGCEMAAAAMAGADGREEAAPAGVPDVFKRGSVLFDPETGRRILIVGEPRRLVNPAGDLGEMIYPVQVEHVDASTWLGMRFAEPILLLMHSELIDCACAPLLVNSGP